MFARTLLPPFLLALALGCTGKKEGNDSGRNDQGDQDRDPGNVSPAKSARYEPIDRETIAAYEKLGAQYGGFVVNDDPHRITGLPEFAEFSPGPEAAAKGLPGFSFQSRPGAFLTKLPPVRVPFGLKLVGTSDTELKELHNLRNLVTIRFWNAQVTDEGIKELRDLKNLTSLHLAGKKITDAGLKDLKHLENLSSLVLADTKISDLGLKDLKALKKLTSLSLAISTKVTNAGLAELAEIHTLTTLNLFATDLKGEGGLQSLAALKNLTTLSLGNTDITDEGLKHLHECRGLTTLSIDGTPVSPAGVALLQKALPACKIRR